MADPEAKLDSQLSALPSSTQDALRKHGFESQWLVSLDEKRRNGQLKNHLDGVVEAPAAEDVVSAPTPSDPRYDEYVARGTAALKAGECALVVLAGGMATRMGGVVKALVEALPGQSFLDLRVAEQKSLGERYGKVPPMWLMTSYATEEKTRAALGEALDGWQVATFVQGLSVRLTEDGDVFKTPAGEPSLYSPGHGDLPDALKRSGLLERFVQEGGKYLLVTNLDNLGGGLDPALIGQHLMSEAAVSCEVVDKIGTDRGGIPARVDGKPVIVEEFRLPDSFDPTTVPVFNVNSLAFDANALLQLDLDWTYFQVEKTVEGQSAIQFERLVNEVTWALPTRYVRVPRQGEKSRFLPVKDHAELAARQPELQALAAARGMT